MKNPVIELDSVYYTYNRGTPLEKEIISNITLNLKKGDALGILGISGAGKTTLAKLISGIYKPTSGLIKTPGTGPGKIGVIFQLPEDQLFCDTVFNDITYSLREIVELPSMEIEKAYRKVCEKVKLNYEKLRLSRPNSLSSGEKRRVAIAGVLAMEPEILIFDEPTAGLDQKASGLLREGIKQLSREGKTVILISHNIEDLIKTVDRIIVLEKGQIAKEGSLKNILSAIADNPDSYPMLPFVTEILARLNAKGLKVRKDIHNPVEALVEIKRVLGIR